MALSVFVAAVVCLVVCVDVLVVVVVVVVVDHGHWGRIEQDWDLVMVSPHQWTKLPLPPGQTNHPIKQLLKRGCSNNGINIQSCVIISVVVLYDT